MGRLAGKVAIVTGAGRGVGAATARLLASEGARVIVNDLDAPEADAVVDEIRRSGGEAMALSGSVTDADFPDRLVQSTVETYGGIDVLVNNAGYIWNGAIQNHSDEQWAAMLDVHATAQFRILRSFVGWLRPTIKAAQAAGEPVPCRKVVNVSSVSGTRGSATQIAYSAGKAAVVGITKTLAQEWGRYNVTVNCVAFGHIDTRLTQPYEATPPTIRVGDREHRVGLSNAQIDDAVLANPLGRSGRPEDAAGAIYLFCIPESDYVSGEVLTCAGGG